MVDADDNVAADSMGEVGFDPALRNDAAAMRAQALLTGGTIDGDGGFDPSLRNDAAALRAQALLAGGTIDGDADMASDDDDEGSESEEGDEESEEEDDLAAFEAKLTAKGKGKSNGKGKEKGPAKGKGKGKEKGKEKGKDKGKEKGNQKGKEKGKDKATEKEEKEKAKDSEEQKAAKKADDGAVAVSQEAPPDASEQIPAQADAEESKAGGVAEEEHAPHVGSHYHQKKLAAGAAAPPKLEIEGEHTVYVANLDWSVDEPQLLRMFGEVDGLKEVRLVRDFLKRSKGYAYVDYDSPEHVTQAVEKLNGMLVNKRAMRVARSLPTKPLFEERTVFVSKLGAATTEAEVREAFAPMGEVLGVRIPTDAATGSPRGYAYVEFANGDSVEAVLAAPPPSLGGQVVKLARSIPMKDHRHQKAANRKDLPSRANQRAILAVKLDKEDPVMQALKCPTTIYVKNLAFKVDEEALREHFATCGEVRQVLLCRNAAGRSRGFGFVEFAKPDEAMCALMLSDSELRGRCIVVSRSQRPITQKKQAEGAGAEEEASAPPTAKRRLDLEAPAVAAGQGKRKLDPEAASTQKGGPPKHKPFRVVKEEPQAASPRSASPDAAAPQAAKAEGDVASAAPKTNADFRAMLLGAASTSA